MNMDGSGRNRELSIQEEREMDRETLLSKMDKLYDYLYEVYNNLEDFMYEAYDFDKSMGEKIMQLTGEIADCSSELGNKIYGTIDERGC